MADSDQYQLKRVISVFFVEMKRHGYEVLYAKWLTRKELINKKRLFTIGKLQLVRFNIIHIHVREIAVLYII